MATKKTVNKADTKSAPGTVLVLLTCKKNMESHNGFKWPAKGRVSAPDWNDRPECVGGLHGLLNGEGDGSLLDWHTDAKWLVVEVDPSTIVDIGGKVKFPRGVVVFCGDRFGATGYLRDHGCSGAIVGGTSTSGDMGTSTSGYRGTSTSGYMGASTSGYMGTSTSGDRGTSTSGDRGTSTSGDRGTSTSGYRGTSTSGDGGILNIRWYDGNRHRLAIFYVGENGIKPNTPYRCDDAGNAVEVKR